MLGAWSVLEPKDAYPRARAAAERASEIDPPSPVINSERSLFYSYARQYDRALQEALGSWTSRPHRPMPG